MKFRIAAGIGVSATLLAAGCGAQDFTREEEAKPTTSSNVLPIVSASMEGFLSLKPEERCPKLESFLKTVVEELSEKSVEINDCRLL